MPKPEIIEPRDVLIVSVVTGRRLTLEEAWAEEWKVCEVCGAPYSPEEIRILQQEGDGHCVSDACRDATEPARFEPLPVDRILVFAQARSHERFRKGLLYKLFFSGDETVINPAYRLAESTDATDEVALAEASRSTRERERARTQEEFWKNMGFVLTKRVRGRFVSWTAIGQ